MKTTKSKALLGVALILIGGLFVTDHLFLKNREIASYEGPVSSESRPDLYDLSDLNGIELSTAFKKNLASSLRVHREHASLGLSWNMFQVRSESGSKVYACEKYPNVELTFQAEGVANAGNVPTLTVRGPCLVSDDGQRVLPLRIPLKNLSQNLHENPIFRVPLGDRGEAFMISSQFLYSEWPPLWNLVGVQLYNDQESLQIDGYELISLLDQALTLDFSEEP